jgi:hypothetical protein
MIGVHSNWSSTDCVIRHDERGTVLEWMRSAVIAATAVITGQSVPAQQRAERSAITPPTPKLASGCMSEFCSSKELNATISEELRKTFERIAKLALQGVQEASDPALSIIEKGRKANSRVTQIINDVMRGLEKVTELMVKAG